MKKIKYFKLEEMPTQPGKYMITIDYSQAPELYTKGSFNILPARLMGLSYANYLRFCRDLFDAEIIGKRNLYPIAVFQKNEGSLALLQLLNNRMSLVLWERDHPEWRKHEEYITLKNSENQKLKEARKNNVYNTRKT